MSGPDGRTVNHRRCATARRDIRDGMAGTGDRLQPGRPDGDPHLPQPQRHQQQAHQQEHPVRGLPGPGAEGVDDIPHDGYETGDGGDRHGGQRAGQHRDPPPRACCGPPVRVSCACSASYCADVNNAVSASSRPSTPESWRPGRRRSSPSTGRRGEFELPQDVQLARWWLAGEPVELQVPAHVVQLHIGQHPPPLELDPQLVHGRPCRRCGPVSGRLDQLVPAWYYSKVPPRSRVDPVSRCCASRFEHGVTVG